MDIQLSLPDYAQLVRRINAEVFAILKQAFFAHANLTLIEPEVVDPRAILVVCNQTRRVHLQSVAIPFRFDDSSGFVASINRAVIMMSAARRHGENGTWTHDAYFGEGGMQTICLSSLDDEAVALAGKLLAEEVRMHLSFELELSC